ncbi:DUF4003 domain-containing protein [Filibacter tadaridae]|uniref:DUF4003 domain-containing protein n=1 Tax=Filibacter tadaridae TaxID=2483811 RepID=A0A3P5WQ19_9BACL|nr:DUF4003 family protein [Filibacter tadaridae]VDC21631.1 hypothetical protein FILTAD_00635 [Filibacter tadaridae]
MKATVISQEVESTYEKVKSLAGWTVDKNVVLTITSYYVTSEREFVAESLNRAIDALKSKASWFSPLRGNLLPMMAAFLDKPGSNIEEEVNRLFAKQQVLKEVGFRNTIHSYLAALLVSDNPDSYEIEARQAKKLYDAMKKQHFFLTSDDDYAYAVLLGKKGEEPVEHALSMRTYYDALRDAGFRSGNELQWLSQVLTYIHIQFNPFLVSRAAEILAHFKKETKVRSVHYPIIGFLTVFDVKDTELTDIIELTHALEQTKPFKWNREMALSIGIGYVMHELTENAEQASISLATSVELILQAQQAVMAATIAAMAASSASNSSNT